MARRARPQPASRPAKCDLFELRAALQGDQLVLRVLTDLPTRTPLKVSVTRPSREYIWTNCEESLPVKQLADGTGIELVKSIDDLDTAALHKYRHWKGRWPSQIDGVPDNSFVIRVVLNALDHRFGACNRDLSGTQIEVRRNGHWIERTVIVAAPIPEWLAGKLP